MVFLPNEDEAEKKAIALIEEIIKKEGLKLVAWRDVPVDHSLVGRFAKVTQPRIKQVFIESELEGDALERELYLARKGMESLAEDRLGDVAPDLFFCSMSNRTIVYKGMLRSAVVGPFFKDLTNPDYTTCFAIYHRRFSTNTTPKWPLAQPFRLLGHNGAGLPV
jgi:glutamate synthase (ferredoxin)